MPMPINEMVVEEQVHDWGLSSLFFLLTAWCRSWNQSLTQHLSWSLNLKPCVEVWNLVDWNHFAQTLYISECLWLKYNTHDQSEDEGKSERSSRQCLACDYSSAYPILGATALDESLKPTFNLEFNCQNVEQCNGIQRRWWISSNTWNCT